MKTVAVLALTILLGVSMRGVAPGAQAGPEMGIGDVNCDGATNSIDAALILQEVGGLLNVLPCDEMGDVNESGSTNAVDASLILQFTAGRIESFDVSDAAARWRHIEDDPQPDLPGDFVDLPRAFAVNGVLAHYGVRNGPNTNAHVTQQVDYSAEGHPPAGGPHWGQGSCGDDPTTAPAFCGPVPWGIYRDEWPEESVVHNMEHGGIVVWYNRQDLAARDQLEAWVSDLGEQGAFVVMMPYSRLPPDMIALTAWARRDEFPSSERTEQRIKEFIRKFNCRFNPEGFNCAPLVVHGDK